MVRLVRLRAARVAPRRIDVLAHSLTARSRDDAADLPAVVAVAAAVLLVEEDGRDLGPRLPLAVRGKPLAPSLLALLLSPAAAPAAANAAAPARGAGTPRTRSPSADGHRFSSTPVSEGRQAGVGGSPAGAGASASAAMGFATPSSSSSSSAAGSGKSSIGAAAASPSSSGATILATAPRRAASQASKASPVGARATTQGALARSGTSVKANIAGNDPFASRLRGNRPPVWDVPTKL